MVGDNITHARIETGPNQFLDLRSSGDEFYAIDLPMPKPDVYDVFRPELGVVRAYNGVNVRCFDSAFLQIRTPEIPDARITRISPTAQRSDFLINLHIPEAFPAASSNVETVGWDMSLMAKRFYQHFPDEFDMINFIAVPSYYNNRYHVSVKNTVQGIGASQFNNTALYGSAGRLLGVNMFPLANYYDGAEHGAVHEVGHQWAVHLRQPPFNVSPHWPFSSMASGIMGWNKETGTQGLMTFCRIFKEGNTVIGRGRGLLPAVFNDFDLYLMGLKHPDEVAEQYIITDQSLIDPMVQGLNNACNGPIPIDKYRTVTVQDIIREAGPRIPGVTSSQKAFRIANVLVTRDGLANEDTMAFYDFFSRRWQEKPVIRSKIGYFGTNAAPFFAATGGRATLSTQLNTTVLPEISPNGIIPNGFVPVAGTRLAAGRPASLFGSNLAAGAFSATNVPLPTALGGVTVLVNGIAAPLYYVSPTQINFQVPWDVEAPPLSGNARDLRTDRLFTVRVQNGGLSSNLAYVNSYPNAPGILTYGNAYAIATNTEAQLIGPDNPAFQGSTLTVYFTGPAELTEKPPTGAIAPLDRLIRVNAAVFLRIGNVTINTLPFVGLTPGGVGLGQFNFTVPNTVQPGTHDMTLSVGGIPSNTAKLIVAARGQ